MATIADKAGREVARDAALRLAGPPALPPKPTLRPDEVARVLGITEKHVRTLVEEGSLEAVDVKSAICFKPTLRITERSLVEFWHQRRIGK